MEIISYQTLSKMLDERCRAIIRLMAITIDRVREMLAKRNGVPACRVDGVSYTAREGEKVMKAYYNERNDNPNEGFRGRVIDSVRVRIRRKYE